VRGLNWQCFCVVHNVLATADTVPLVQVGSEAAGPTATCASAGQPEVSTGVWRRTIPELIKSAGQLQLRARRPSGGAQYFMTISV